MRNKKDRELGIKANNLEAHVHSLNQTLQKAVADLNVILPKKKKLEQELGTLAISFSKQEEVLGKNRHQSKVLKDLIDMKKAEEKLLTSNLAKLEEKAEEVLSAHQGDKQRLEGEFVSLEASLGREADVLRDNVDSIKKEVTVIEGIKADLIKSVDKVRDEINSEESKLKESLVSIKADIKESEKELKSNAKKIEDNYTLLRKQTELYKDKVVELKLREKAVSVRERNLLILKGRLQKTYTKRFPGQIIKL